MDAIEFAQKIKAKIPDYEDMDDLDLARKMVNKYPEDYSDVVFPDSTVQDTLTQEPIPQDTIPEEPFTMGDQVPTKQEPVGFSENFEQALFPGATDYLEGQTYDQIEVPLFSRQGLKQFGTQNLIALGDVFGLVDRGAAALENLTKKDSESFLETLQDPEAGIFKENRLATRDYWNDMEQNTSNPVLKELYGAMGFIGTFGWSVMESPGGIKSLAKGVAAKAQKTFKQKLPKSDDLLEIDEVIKQADREGIPLTYGDASQKPHVQWVEENLEKVPGSGFMGARKEGAEKVKESMSRRAAKVQKDLQLTNYKDLPRVEKLAAQGDEGAIKVIKEIESAGEDWTNVIQASGNLKHLRARRTATKLYDKVEDLAGDTKIPTLNSKSEINKILFKLRDSKIKDAGDISLIKDFETHNKAFSVPTTFGELRLARSKLGMKIDGLTKNNELVKAAELGRLKSAIERDMQDFGQSTLASKTKAIEETGKLPTQLEAGLKSQGLTLAGPKKAVSASDAALARYGIEPPKTTPLMNRAKKLDESLKKADKFYREAVIPYRDKGLAKAMKNKDADEVYGAFIRAGKGDKGKRFHKSLDPKGQAAVRYGMITNAIEKATTEGTDLVSPQKFINSLSGIKDARKVFFKGEAGKELEGYFKVLNRGKRFGQYLENPPNGSRAVFASLFFGTGVGAVKNLPATIGTVAGGIVAARMTKVLLTSKKGRNLLLSIGNAKTPEAVNKLIHKSRTFLDEELIKAQAPRVQADVLREEE